MMLKILVALYAECIAVVIIKYAVISAVDTRKVVF